jgi:hypothetical protein
MTKSSSRKVSGVGNLKDMSHIRVNKKYSSAAATNQIVYDVTTIYHANTIMGRPPNVPCHSPSRPWAPPLHIAGGILRGTVTPHSNKVRQFVLPIPPVPAATSKAIRASLASTVQPFAAQQNRIRILTTKFHDQRAKAAASQKRIAELEDEKELGLRDIRETRQQETADIIAAVERKLRSRYNKEAAAAHAIWKEKLDEECEAKRKAWKFEEQQKDEEKMNAVVHDDEPDPKRLKVQDKVETEKLETTDAIGITTISETGTMDAPIVKKSDEIRKKIQETEATLEKLTETRTEMIWLLKQVIKAEEKRKIDLNKKAMTTTGTGTTASSSSNNTPQMNR